MSAPAGYSLNNTVYPVNASVTASTKTTTASTTNCVYTATESEKLAGTAQVGWLGGYPDGDGNISYTFYAMDEFTAAGTQDDGLVVVAAFVKEATTTTETSTTFTEAGEGGDVQCLFQYDLREGGGPWAPLPPRVGHLAAQGDDLRHRQRDLPKAGQLAQAHTRRGDFRQLHRFGEGQFPP